MGKSSARLKKGLYRTVIGFGVLTLFNPTFATELAYDRVIHLDGTSNTRDIGGYQAGDQRIVRWRQIIRSENLSRLTPGDFQKLEEIGVKTVIDLRTEKEHNKSPTVWLGESPPRFLHFPIGDAENDWFRAQSRMMKKPRFTEDQSLEHMIAGYRMIADEGPDSFQKLMDVVLDQSNWPILIHCSAGKDRAGVAAALILEALGVDRNTIMEEYLLSNEISRAEEKAVLLAERGNNSRSLKKLRRSPTADAWFPIVGVRPEMLEAFYSSVDERYGSMEAFLTEMGIDQDARTALVASLTTE
jgi:protein-tyrosine phosphatase